MSKLIALSWTRLDCFEQCPRKFQGSYITKDFPKPDFDAEHFRKGRLVHKVLEERVKDKTPIPYPIKDGLDEWHVDVRFLEDKLMKVIDKHDTVLVEHNITLGARFEQLTWFDKKAWWRATFDCMVIIGDTAIIIDWKTGKVRGKSDQLKLFAAIAFKTFENVNRVLTAYVWCEHPNKEPVYAEYDRTQCDDLWDDFGDRAELVQIANESGNWQPKPNPYCKWCDALPTQCEHKGAE